MAYILQISGIWCNGPRCSCIKQLIHFYFTDMVVMFGGIDGFSRKVSVPMEIIVCDVIFNVILLKLYLSFWHFYTFLSFYL